MNSKYYFKILFIFLVASCKPKATNYYYPSKEKINEVNIDTLEFNEFESYEKLIEKLENLNYKGAKYGFFKIDNGKEVYNIGVTTRHGFCNPKLIKMKNLITISEDSVMKNEKVFSINYLPEILKRDLKNNGAENEYATNSSDLIVSLALRDYRNVKHLNEYLINIIESFNQINKEEKYELNIQIDREFFFHRKLFENLPK